MNLDPKLTFVIRRTRHFHGPGLDERRDLVADENGDALTFNGRNAAHAHIAKLQSEEYQPDHHESGCPEYAVFSLAQLPDFLKPFL